MYGYYYFDPTYLLLVIGMVLSLLASAKVKSTFSVYSRVRSALGLTGADAARRILRMSGIKSVSSGMKIGQINNGCYGSTHIRQPDRPL